MNIREMELISCAFEINICMLGGLDRSLSLGHC